MPETHSKKPLFQASIVSVFPGMFKALSEYGITKRAIAQKLVSLDFYNPRDFTENRHQRVDDRPYGGGPGMIMQAGPLASAIDAAKQNHPGAKIVYLSPQGEPFTQKTAREIARKPSPLILLAGRYEGIDERLIELKVDTQWSIGDYILTGGELPIMVVLDCVIRLLPGSVGSPGSLEVESFESGYLDHPHYTRPQVFSGLQVPPVLLGGDHAKIKAWRAQARLSQTQRKRPDLLET